jgi:putative flippase GtrA
LKELFRKYKELITYLFFGGATTVVNIVVFFICQDFLGFAYKLSNVVGWVLSVLFAFYTNKYFVFESQHANRSSFYKEMFLFYWYRALSFAVDMGLMILFIEQLKWGNFWAKIITQVVVVVLNYFFSKWFVFQKEKE